MLEVESYNRSFQANSVTPSYYSSVCKYELTIDVRVVEYTSIIPRSSRGPAGVSQSVSSYSARVLNSVAVPAECVVVRADLLLGSGPNERATV